MSNRDMVLHVALTLLAATVQATPDQPDFSGRWVLDTPALASPDTARRLVVTQPITRTTVFGEPMKPAFLRISIRREGVSANSEETRLIGVGSGIIRGVVGGITSGVSKEGLTVGNSTREETVWRRDSLVFANLSYGPDGPRTGDWTERREEWSLEPDGRLRVEISAESWKSAWRLDVYFYRRECAPAEAYLLMSERAVESAALMGGERAKHAGEQVIFLALPPRLLDGLPDEDQRAIKAMVGKPVTLVGYDEDGRAELEFDDPFDVRTDDSSHTHTIWVEPEFIARVQA